MFDNLAQTAQSRTRQDYAEFNILKYSGMLGSYFWVGVDPCPTYARLLAIAVRHFGVDKIVENLHITVTYAKSTTVPRRRISDFLANCPEYLTSYKYKDVCATYWRGNGEGYIVLTIESPELDALHLELRGLGIHHEWPEYQPHITLVRGIGPPDLNVVRCIDAMNRYLLSCQLPGHNRNTGSLVISDIDVWN